MVQSPPRLMSGIAAFANAEMRSSAESRGHQPCANSRLLEVEYPNLVSGPAATVTTDETLPLIRRIQDLEDELFPPDGNVVAWMGAHPVLGG
jgi:hypothetical protein